MAFDANKQIVIDNNFFVPLGVVDVRQRGLDDASYYGSTDNGGGAGVTDPSSTPSPNNPGSVIPIPSSFSVVAQQVHITPDGKAVVDVTLEFPDVIGISAVDVRITKADPGAGVVS